MHMDYRFCFILSFVCFITQHSLFFISFLAFFSQPVVDKATGRIRERKGGGVLHDGRPCWCVSPRPIGNDDDVHLEKSIWFLVTQSFVIIIKSFFSIMNRPFCLSLSLSLVLLCSIQGQHYPLPTTATTKNSVVCSRL